MPLLRPEAQPTSLPSPHSILPLPIAPRPFPCLVRDLQKDRAGDHGHVQSHNLQSRICDGRIRLVNALVMWDIR